MIFKNIYYRDSPGSWKLGNFDIYKILFSIIKIKLDENYYIKIALYSVEDNIFNTGCIINIDDTFLKEYGIKKLISDNIIIKLVKYYIEDGSVFVKYKVLQNKIENTVSSLYKTEEMIKVQEVYLD